MVDSDAGTALGSKSGFVNQEMSPPNCELAAYEFALISAPTDHDCCTTPRTGSLLSSNQTAIRSAKEIVVGAHVPSSAVIK